MDFAGLDVLLCSDTNNNNNNNSAFSFDTNPKSSSSSIKHEQSLSITPTTHNQDVKKLCLDDLLQSRSNTCSVFSAADSHNMLSFSSPQCNVTQPFPFYHPRNTSTGYGVRGLFTPSQWMELEHQALIYKYITVNAPIPSNLLIPIRKALETAAFCSFPTNLRHTAYGWGGFHMGFSNNSDPEPGRCRRTDGKKWRCSRDAVADQKYCERHMNRGRHRSRKPVEGQTGANTTVTAAVNAAVVSAPAAAVTTTSSTVNSRLNQQNQHQINRSFLNRGSDKIEDRTGVSMLPNSSIGFTHKPISVSSEFGFVCSDSLLNPLHKNDNAGQKSPNSLHQFMDDWPHSDKTQLSISIPMPSSGFISSNSSPIHKKVKFSPLRMGLGVGNTTAAHQVFDEMSQPVNLIPVSWEASSGGPLGEVLNHNASNSPSPLNLMTDGWESSQHTTLSPTGVLQKTGFGCFSSSSAGSSPRTDNSLLGSTSMITSSLPLL